MLNIEAHTMIAAAPLSDLLARARESLEEARELAPESTAVLERARFVRDLEAAMKEAIEIKLTCDSQNAGKIMDVSPRQATNLAKAGRVRAWQNAEGGPWTFDVRSCHAYRERGETAA